MQEQDLIKKVEDFLLESNTIFEKNSIEYIGIRKNHEMQKDKPKDYYFLSYEVVVDKQNVYSTHSYFVLIDKMLEEISYVIDPQSFNKIE